MSERLVSLETERAILAAGLASPEILPLLEARLSVHHFSDRALKLIWLALLGLVKDAEPVNFLALEARLQRSGHLAEVGGGQAIISLDMDLPASDERSVLSYLDTLDDRLVRRQLVEVSRRLRLEAETYKGPARDLFARLSKGLDALDVRSNGPQSPDLGSVLGEVWPQPDRGAEGLPGRRTGFPRWDDLTGGMRPGALWMLGGRQGHGKSSLALQVAMRQARAGVRCGVRSLEMSRDEVGLRLLVQESGVPLRSIERGPLTLQQRAVIDGVVDELKGLPLWIEESGERTAEGVGRWARRMKLGLVVVDHLDLFRAATEPATIPQAAADLKALAGELGASILALRQLNRYGARLKDAAPQDEDMRYGGEDSAVVVSLLAQREDHADLHITKNRFGPRATVRLNWRPETTSFAEEA